MNMRNVKIWGILLPVVLAFASCRSGKEMTVVDEQDVKEPVEWVDKMASTALKTGTVTSKLNLELHVNGKSLSVGGNCNLKRDEVIQLSLVALGFMEVGRLEFTPQYLMMINRMEREYVKVEYADVPYLQQAGIDFYALQALFWSDVFAPGKRQMWTEADFAVSRNGENTILTSQGDGVLQCQFVIDVLTGLIRNTSVVLTDRPSVPRLNWTYLHFASVDQKSFPDKMQLSVTGNGEDLTAVFSLNNLKWNAKTVELSEEPGGKYRKVPADVILKRLIK